MLRRLITIKRNVVLCIRTAHMLCFDVCATLTVSYKTLQDDALRLDFLRQV